MVRVITQETYDEVVKENIEMFDMPPEEAAKEAIAQFEAQGVDLSNIIKELTIGGGDHLVSTAVKKLKELSSVLDYNDDLVLKQLDILVVECDKDIAHRVKAGKEGAYNLLIDLLDSRVNKYVIEKNIKDEKMILSVLNTLNHLMNMQPDLLDEKGIRLITDSLCSIANEDIQVAILKWTSTCCLKHEMNRQSLFAKNIVSSLKHILTTKNNVKLISESLRVVRRLTLDDDIRVEFGKAHDHAREMGVQMLKTLTKMMSENTKSPVVSEIMLTIAKLLVRYELCSVVADGGVSSLFTILADNYDNENVIQQANKLLTALAGNDDVKRLLVLSGIVPIIISLLRRHQSSPVAASLILKSISSLSLREPGHSLQFLENGAPEVLVECMKMYPDNAEVQRNGCWAIRNMVARCKDHNAKFHELGIQEILNRSYEKFNKEFGYDIKSALRDLDCDVKLDEQWTGKGGEIDY